MDHLLQFFRESLRDNFGATVFSIVMSAIAAIFVAYLIFDGVKTFVQNARRKKMHREEHNVRGS